MLTVVRRERQYAYATQEQVDTIKNALTFNNPAYANAKRFSKSRYISIPPYLTYYTELGKSSDGRKIITVPIGVDIESILNTQIDVLREERVCSNVIYPEFKLELRKDQKKAFEHYYKSIQTLHPKRIVQLPTGKGKSILALYTAKMLHQKTLILVHKDDLIVSWTQDIHKCFGDDFEVGLIKAKSRKVGEQITLATFQTLYRMSEEELAEYTNQFGLVIHDEVHHCALNMFNLVDKFNSFHKMGLSATPVRSDGLNFVFDLFFGGICHYFDPKDDDEDISSVEVRVLDSKATYNPFYYKGQVFNLDDFSPKQLPKEVIMLDSIPYSSRPKVSHLVIDDSVVRNRKTKIKVCKKILEHYDMGHSVLALFTQKEHIRLYNDTICRILAKRGIKKPENEVLLYYGDSKESSEELMKRAENRESRITLATYAKATEGTNVKSWEVLFLVSSLNNEKNVEQATGRIRRKKEGKISPVIVYDVRYEGYSIRSHYQTRKSAYTRLKYTIKDPKSKETNSMFSRGYHLT